MFPTERMRTGAEPIDRAASRELREPQARPPVRGTPGRGQEAAEWRAMASRRRCASVRWRQAMAARICRRPRSLGKRCAAIRRCRGRSPVEARDGYGLPPEHDCATGTRCRSPSTSAAWASCAYRASCRAAFGVLIWSRGCSEAAAATSRWSGGKGQPLAFRIWARTQARASARPRP